MFRVKTLWYVINFNRLLLHVNGDKYHETKSPDIIKPLL